MGRCGLTLDGQQGWICGTGSILFRPKKVLIDPFFITIALGCDFIKQNLQYVSVGATMENLNTSILSKVSVPVSPIEEQRIVVEGVKRIENQYTNLIAKEMRSIAYFAELTKVLISTAVTGKIKI